MLGLTLTAAGQTARDHAFTSEERRALRAGRLVRRPRQHRRGGFRYIGGTSWQRVRAPRRDVWAVVLDVRNYPQLIPAVSEARVVQDRGARRLLFLSHRMSLAQVSYFAWAEVDATSRTIRFELDRSRPHDVRDGRGFLTVDAYGAEASIVTWGVMADPGVGVLTGLIGPSLQDWILRVPWCLRGMVEHRAPGC